MIIDILKGIDKLFNPNQYYVQIDDELNGFKTGETIAIKRRIGEWPPGKLVTITGIFLDREHVELRSGRQYHNAHISDIEKIETNLDERELDFWINCSYEEYQQAIKDSKYPWEV